MINGCNNNPRPSRERTYPVQDGWRYVATAAGITREPIIIEQKFVMEEACVYVASATDQGCSGCVHAPHLAMKCQ